MSFLFTQYTSPRILMHQLKNRKTLGPIIQHSYNLSSTLVVQVPWMSSKLIFGKDFNAELSLDDLNAHGAIEHDASYTRM